MLNKFLVGLAHDNAQILLSKECYLKTKPGTTIDVLVGASRQVTDEVLLNGESAADIPNLLVESTRVTDVANVSLHKTAMDAAEKEVTKRIEQVLYLVREIVNPMTRDIVERVEASAANALHSDNNVITLIRDDYEPIWSSGELYNVFKRYQDSRFSSARLSISNMPMITVEEMISTMTTGIADLDIEIKQWASNLPREVFSSAYRRVFIEGEAFGNTPVMGRSGNFSRNEILFLALFVNGIEDNMHLIKGATVTLSALRAKLAEAKNVLGKVVCLMFTDREKNIKNHRLVIGPIKHDKQKDSKVARVMGDVLDLFINNGVSEDAIKGYLLTEQLSTMSLDKLLEDGPSYEMSFKRIQSIRDQRVRSEIEANTREYLKEAFYTVVRERGKEQDLPHATIHEQIEKAFSTVRTKDMADVPLLTRRLVCCAFFPDSDAITYFELMEQIAELDNELDIVQVAFIATVRLYARWIAKQLICC